MALKLLDKVKLALSNSINDDKGWIRQGQFTPKKQIEPLIKTIQNYQQQVNQAKQTPFFNSNNTPTQWIGKVGQEFKNRGIGEGIHGLTNPITMNPYIRPITEEVVGNVRTANYKAGRPSHLLNIMLGQQDHQMADKGKSGKETYLEKLEKLFATQGLIKAQQFTQPAVSNVQAWANPQVRQQFNQAVIQPKINQITGPQPKGPLPTMAPLVSQGSLKNPLLDKLAEITGQSTRALINAVPSLVNSFSNKYVYNPETKKAFPASRLRPENIRFSDAEQKLWIKGFKDKSVKSTKEWQEINKRFWDNSTEEGIRLAMTMALTKSQKMGKFDEEAVQENFNRMFGKGGSTVAVRNGPGAVIPNIPSTKLSLPPVSPIKTGITIENFRGGKQLTDVENAKVGDWVLVKSENGTPYEGILESKGPKNLTVKVNTSMYGEQSIKLPTDGLAGYIKPNISPIKTGGDELLNEAKKYSNADDFVDAKIFRDAHSAPRFDKTPVKQRMEEGGDYNLLEVVKGQHNQPSDYFDTRVGPRYYMYDDQQGMESLTAINNVKRGAKTVTAYRIVPKDIKVDKLIDGDWISFSKQYALDHGEHRFGEGAYKIIEQEVPAKYVWWDGNDIREWGYDTGKTKELSRSELKDIWNQAHNQQQDFQLPEGVMGFTGPTKSSPLSPENKGIKQPTIKIKPSEKIKIKAGNDQNLLSNQQNPLGTGKPSVSSSQESGLQTPQSTLPKIKIKVGQPNQISFGKPPSEPIIPQIKLSDIEKKIYGSETKLGNTGNKISVGSIGDKIRIVENKANEIIAKGLTAKNPVIRTSATLFQDLFGGAGKSQGQLSQKAQFRGGTDYATKIAGDTQNYVYNLLNNDTKSLERVHSVLDPEISKIKVDEASLTANEKEALKMVREVSDYINDTNYSLGFISKDLWQKNRGGKYLARAYEVFDYPPEVADFIKNKSIKFDLNPFKKRTEMTDWKKENAITDPAYLISKRLQQTLFNVEVKKYVDWATKSNLISDVQRPGFVQLSDSKAYGSAAGKWIRKDALEDIKGFFLTNDIGQKAYDILNWYDRNPLRRGQKMLKTVFNPAVRLGNRTGNYVFAWLNGINPATFTKNRIWAKNALNTNDPIYRYAVKNGLTGSDITKADITRISAELKRGITDKNTLQKINDWAKESYGRVDDVSKVAAFKTWLDRGISPEEALNRTRRGFQDYNMVGMLYDLGAKIPVLGNPFVRFASESIRIAKNAAVDHPFRLAATISAWVLFKNVMSRMTGETEKDRKTREGRVGASHLPFTNISTSVMTPYGEINASRLLGFSSTFTPEDTGKFGSFGTDLSKYGPFQNPLDARNYTNDPIIGPVISLATDKDFRGKSIADPKQNKYTGSLLTPGEQNMNRLGYGLRSYLPPSFTDLYNIGAAIQEKENVYGQVKTPLQAILRTYPGIKIEQFGPEEAEATRQRNADYNAYELDYIQKQINAVKKQQAEGKITPQQAEKRIDSLNREKITSQSDGERTFETSPEAPKDIMERISLATKATVTNPTNALKVIQAIFTEEKMRKLSGDTLIFERETNLNKTKEKGDAVDHIIPLSLGGDNSDKNKRYISAEANQEKAKLETSLARKLANGEITGSEARKQIKNYMEKYSDDYTINTSTKSADKSTEETIGKIYTITNEETGKDTEIDLTFPEYPKLTGLTEADKALKSSYYSALSKIKTNATKLYNDGQLKAEEYNDILTKVSTSKSKSGSGKTKSKGGKITIKTGTTKFTPIKIKTYKPPTLKISKGIKKPSISNLKSRRTIKIKV